MNVEEKKKEPTGVQNLLGCLAGLALKVGFWTIVYYILKYFGLQE